MATTRLRKTFQYPADNSDDDDTPADLDEEEQEKLIRQLKKEDEDRNELYKRIFLALPILAILSFLPILLTSTVYQARLTSFLCITSLSATTYILLLVPNTDSATPRRRTLLTHPEPGPLKRYIEPGNGALSLLLALNALIYRDRTDIHSAFWVLCLLPITCFLIITLAKRVMLSVDVGQLEKLRYGYKGA